MADIKIDSDSGKFKAGADQDLEVYSDGSHSYIKNTVNDQTIILSTKTGGTNTSGITLDGSNNVTLLGDIIIAWNVFLYVIFVISAPGDYIIKSFAREYYLFKDWRV